jgi:carboxylesterase type B
MPVLASRALWEGKSFSDGNVNTNESLQADLRALIPNATDDFFARLTKLYPGQDYYQRRVEIFGDFVVNCPTAWILSAVNAKNMSAYKLIFKDGHEKHGAEAQFIYEQPNRTYHLYC